MAAAERYLEEALVLNRKSLPILEGLGELALQQNHGEIVMRIVRKIRHLDRTSTYADYLEGSYLVSQGKDRRAERFLRRSLRSRETAESLNSLGALLMRKGKLEESETALRRALQIDAGLAQAWDALGVLLTRTGSHKEALECLRKAVSLAPGSPVMCLHMAELYAKTNRRMQALELTHLVAKKSGELSAKHREELRELDEVLQVG